MKVWSKLLSFLKPQKISNKDVDLSDDNIFNRELKSIRKLKIEPAQLQEPYHNIYTDQDDHQK